MDPELKALLTETLALAKENHRMLRTMRRDAWLGFVLKVIFWAVIIIAPLYFLAPYLSSLPSAAQLQDVLKVYQGNYN
jgi:Kef-type K+ transport system membrane component KefB